MMNSTLLIGHRPCPVLLSSFFACAVLHPEPTARVSARPPGPTGRQLLDAPANAPAEAAEGDAALALQHRLQVLLGRLQLQAVQRRRRLARVLEVHAQV